MQAPSSNGLQQRGASLIEILGAIAVLAVGLVAASDQINRFIDRRKEQAEAEHLAEATKAANLCLASNANSVSACNTNLAWLKPPFTASGTSTTTAFGARLSFDGTNVLTTGGSYSRGQRERIAALVGASIAAATPQGIAIDLKKARLASRDPLLLHRNDVGNVEFNTMRTDLLMDNNDIRNVGSFSVKTLSATSGDFQTLNSSQVSASTIVGENTTFTRGLSAGTINAMSLSSGYAQTSALNTPVIRPTFSATSDTSCANFPTGTLASLSTTTTAHRGKPLWCANGKWQSPIPEIRIFQASMDTNQMIVSCPDQGWQVLGGGGRVLESNEGIELRDVGDWSFKVDPKTGGRTWTWPDDPTTQQTKRVTLASGNTIDAPVWIPKWAIVENRAAGQITLKGSLARSEPQYASGKWGWVLRGNANRSKMDAFVVCIRTGAWAAQGAGTSNNGRGTLDCINSNASDNPACAVQR